MAQIGGRRFDHFHIPQVQLGEDFDHGGYFNHFIGEDLEDFFVLDLVHHLFSTMGCPKFDNSNASNGIKRVDFAGGSIGGVQISVRKTLQETGRRGASAKHETILTQTVGHTPRPYGTISKCAYCRY